MIKEYTQEKLRAAFFDKTHETFVLLDKDFFVVDVNQAFISVVKKKKDDIVGNHISELSPGIENTIRFDLYKKVLTTGRSILIENERTPPIIRGSRMAKIRAFKVGDYLGISALDTTEFSETVGELRLLKMDLELANEHLEIKNKDLQDLSFIAAHDLKAPISNLQSLMSLLETNVNLQNEDKLVLGKLNDVVGHLNEKIKALNKVIALKSTVSSEKSLIRFEDILIRIKSEISEKISLTEVKIQTDFRSCPEINMNPIQLHSIIFNLLNNAIKYRSLDRPSVVKLKATSNGKQVIFECEDNGIGFDQEKSKDKIFKLFQRMHTHVEGLGIGLYIVQSVVSANGGKIEIESEKNVGTKFTVYL